MKSSLCKERGVNQGGQFSFPDWKKLRFGKMFQKLEKMVMTA